MGYASYNEDISERQGENVPARRIYGLLDSSDPTEYVVACDTVARDIEIFRARIKSYVLSKSVPPENLLELEKLYRCNETWRTQCEDIHRRINNRDENVEYLMGKIVWREIQIAENLHTIVNLTLSPIQKFNVGAFERRLINGQPRKAQCKKKCEEDLLENPDNFCINCGLIKCSYGHCYCKQSKP